MKRERYIDIARGISMICIILGHLGNHSINRVVFTFHVPIFFFITGYFMDDRLPILDFVKKKARALLIPYTVTCLLIIVLSGIKALILYDSGTAVSSMVQWLYAAIYGAGDSYKEPFYIKAIGAIWFLWASFWGSIFLRMSLAMKQAMRIVFLFLLFAVGYASRTICWFPLSIQAGACAALFMYFGYLSKEFSSAWGALPQEHKSALTIFALLTWLSFIKDFKSFWFVHCDFGRGMVDVFGCMCGCYIVIVLSQCIERHMQMLSSILGFLGKNSIVILCAHIIELNLMPWWPLMDIAVSFGLPKDLRLYCIVAGKFVVVISAVVFCTYFRITRKIFGISPMKAVSSSESSMEK